MKTDKKSWLGSMLAVIGVVLCSAAASGSSRAAEAPAEKGLTVTEWVILVCDPNVPQASAGALFHSTLPDFVAGRRPAAPPQKMGEAMPIGVIRLSGGAVDERVDILLENKGGKFLAQWPKAQQRSSGLLWQNLEPKSDGVALEAVTPGHWFNSLREPAGAYWTREGKGEKFILYDPELSYILPLRLKSAGDGTYELSNGGSAPLRDVTLYQKKPDGWHTATLSELAPGPKGATSRPATKPAQPRAVDASIGGVITHSGTTVTIANRAMAVRTTATESVGPESSEEATAPAPSATPPTTAPATGALPTTSRSSQASTQPAVRLSVDTRVEKDALVAVSPWGDRMAAAGLPTTDLGLILSILQKHALDPQRVTAVYRLDPSELDRLLPLEVTPQPKKIVRVGLVIALNVDPALGDEIDRLIAQLGDDDWSKREAAYKAIAKLGPAAKPKLQGALKHKDLEVVYRAEKLIQALTAPPAPTQNNGLMLEDR